MSKKGFDIILQGAQTGVQLCSFLAFVAFFFAGLLLTKENSAPAYIETWSLSLLFMSAVSFFFAALFYSNLAGKAYAGANDERQAVYGNLLSEFPGTYGIMFATPLSVYSYSGNRMLGLIVFATVSLGIFIYQALGNESSIIERYFYSKKVLSITFVLIASGLVQLLSAFTETFWVFTSSTALLWIIIIGITAFCWKNFQGIADRTISQ